MYISAPNSSSVPLWLRVSWGVTSIVLAGLFVTAAILEPDEQGLGTHRQLGLPPCSLRVLLGVRCPACGMTTSWALLTDGRPIDALHANAGGVLLGLIAVASAPWLMFKAVRGTVLRESHLLLLAVALVAALGVAIIEWILRLVAAG